MASAATLSLSRKDAAVMQALFDPEASLQNAITIDSTLNDPYDRKTNVEIEKQEKEALLLINEEKPTTKNIQDAIHRLDGAIEKYPMYFSAWNNRAQATRMLFDLENAKSYPTEIQAVYNDLSQAINLAEPRHSLGTVSASAARVLSSAYTHRGYILWRASRSTAPEGLLDAIEETRGLDKDRLEEFASRDFARGGRYGNQTAQQLAVKTNPYAKLCGSIVKEAIQKEIADFQSRSQQVS